MSNLNKVMLIGRLTRDPELRYIATGTAVCDFGLAINREFKDRETEEKKEQVTFVDITVWGRTAECVNEYCQKGRLVFIEGRLEYQTWEDKDTGAKRSKLKVIGERIQFLDKPRQEQDEHPARAGKVARPGKATDKATKSVK